MDSYCRLTLSSPSGGRDTGAAGVLFEGPLGAEGGRAAGAVVLVASEPKVIFSSFWGIGWTQNQHRFNISTFRHISHFNQLIK